MASKQLQIFSTAICKGDRKGEPVRSDGRAKGPVADTTRPDRAKGITMQQRANINKPLRVKAIYLKGNNKPLLDRIVWIYYNFLVVAENENDSSPTWYNIDMIDRLESVEEMADKARQTRISIF